METKISAKRCTVTGCIFMNLYIQRLIVIYKLDKSVAFSMNIETSITLLMWWSALKTGKAVCNVEVM